MRTLPDTPNVQIELRRTSESWQSAIKDPFRRYLAALRCGSLYADGVSRQQIKEWEESIKYRPQIDRAKADWKERIDHIQSIKRRKLRRGDKSPEPVPTDSDANTLAFNAKILPNLKEGILSGTLYTEATLATMNLPGWADTIARYARGVDDPKHQAKVRAFLVELGKAVDSGPLHCRLCPAIPAAARSASRDVLVLLLDLFRRFSAARRSLPRQHRWPYCKFPWCCFGVYEHR